MMGGITLRTAHNAHELPDHVELVIDMVRSLSNKYVPILSLDKIEIDLLHGLKDFCQQARKRAAVIKPNEAPKSNADSWHEAEQPDDDNHN
jgi:hypothetical protein